MGILFGTDGVRGVANKELTAELANKLGRAATVVLGENTIRPLFVVGRDTRISGCMLESALAAGISSAGGDVILVGVVPTPTVAYLVRELKAQAGVVISASHNPYPDNGIKFFSNTGYKLPDEIEDRLERLVLDENDTMPRPTAGEIGNITYAHNELDRYLKFVKTTVNTDFKGLKIVIDCANGAAYEVSPKAFKDLGAEVIVINDKPDGVNINNNCGSTHLEGLQKAVLDHKADFGIAHDGDSDRCLAVDEKGEIVDGDEIMVMCAKAMKQEGTLKQNMLVATVMSNIGLYKAIKEAGINIKTTPVGDRYVLETMVKEDAVLGGEQSGHIIFKDYNTTGDGVVTALYIASIVKKANKRLSELKRQMNKYPQLLVNVRLKSKEGWDTNKNIAVAIAEGEQELGENGRILVRPSGTEPLIRVMAEGPCKEQLMNTVNKIAKTIKQELV